MKMSNSAIKELRKKVSLCLSNVREENNLFDILCLVQDDDPKVALVAIQGINKVFTHYFNIGLLDHCSILSKDLGDDSSEKLLLEWLQKNYHLSVDILLCVLDRSHYKIQVASLEALLKFLTYEARSAQDKLTSNQNSFPLGLIMAVVSKVISNSEDSGKIIKQLTAMTKYDDFRFYIMKCIKQLLVKTPLAERSEAFLLNVLSIIGDLHMPDPNVEDLTDFLALNDCDNGKNDHRDTKVSSVGEHKKLFTKCWMEFLNSKLNYLLYRRVLVGMDEAFMLSMSNALQLADFLTLAFEYGGAISLLALNGIYVLVKKYNLNYPDFYKKLYSLLQPELLHSRYKARFFFLADIFLSSTHLSAYLVASFIKRLARLALTAPPPAARLCLVFLYNLLVRHPACDLLAHRADMTLSDLFLAGEGDPSRTHALESTLWEVKLLQNHICPDIALEAMKIDREIKEEQPLTTDILDASCDNHYRQELKRKVRPSDVQLKTVDPKSLMIGKYFHI